MGRSCRILGTLVLLFVVPGVGLSEAEKKPLGLGVEEHISTEVVTLPLIIGATKPKHELACVELTRTLQPSDLIVREGGEESTIVAISRKRMPSHHVLMLDTSESMTSQKRFEPMIHAAQQYIEWLIPDDGVPRAGFADDVISIAGFDDDLILYAPPTPLRAPGAKQDLLRALGRVSTSYYTTLGESLENMIENLQTLPKRPVVILISDGADIDGNYRHESIYQLVNRTENLTVFPIGLGLSSVGQDDHKDFLANLASYSGGKFFDRGKSGGNLLRVFELIRLRLASEFSISYLSRAYGQGRDDTKQQNRVDEHTLRREVSIEPRRPQAWESCHIYGFKPWRYVSQPKAEPDPSRKTPSPEKSGSGPLEIWIQDIARDFDPLWVFDDKLKTYRPSLDRTALPSEERKRLLVTFPTLKLANEPVEAGAPEDAVEALRMLLIRPDFDPRLLGGMTSGGNTFFRYRGQVARLMYDSYPSVRRWVRGRLAEEIERDVRQRLSPEESLTSEQLAQIINERLTYPSTRELIRLLAAWRGDVFAEDLVLSLELGQANGLLTTKPEKSESVLREVDQVQRNYYPAIPSAFFLPLRSRILTLWIPTYDPVRRVFGFYRVILPRFKFKFYSGGADVESVGMVPTHLYGLQFLRFLMGIPVDPSGPGPLSGSAASDIPEELAEIFRAEWRVSDVDSYPLLNRWQVTETASVGLEFSPVRADGPHAVRFALRAQILNAAVEPICLEGPQGQVPPEISDLMAQLELATCATSGGKIRGRPLE